jgi:signal transduction histidine kinase
MLHTYQDSSFRFFISLAVFLAGAFLLANKPAEYFLALTVLYLIYGLIFGAEPLLNKGRRPSTFWSILLLAADVSAISVAIFLTGGVNSPLFMLYAAVFCLCLVRQNVPQFVYSVVLSVLLYVGIVFYSVNSGQGNLFKGISQVILLAALSGALWIVVAHVHRDKVMTRRLSSQSTTLAQICSLVAGSLDKPAEVIRRMSQILEAETGPYGLKCRIDIRKTGEYFIPPSGSGVALSVPILMGGMIGGTLLVNRSKGAQLTKSDQDFFSVVANAIGLYCHRARVWEDFQAHLEKVEASLLLSASSVSNEKEKGELLSYRKNLRSMIDVVGSERGEWTFSPTVLDLKTLVYEEIEAGLSARADKKLNLNLEGDFKNIPSITGDEGQLRKLFQHLLNIVVGASPDHSVVKISMKSDGAALIFAFEDQVQGCPAGPIHMSFAKIFDRRLDEAQTEPDWLNWGLVVCKRIVDAHKGHIWAESKGPGKGRVFSFSLPLSFSTSVINV